MKRSFNGWDSRYLYIGRRSAHSQFLTLARNGYAKMTPKLPDGNGPLAAFPSFSLQFHAVFR
jgi:hypothetical protein